VKNPARGTALSATVSLLNLVKIAPARLASRRRGSLPASSESRDLAQKIGNIFRTTKSKGLLRPPSRCESLGVIDDLLQCFSILVDEVMRSSNICYA
jgi:hypothetical protein